MAAFYASLDKLVAAFRHRKQKKSSLSYCLMYSFITIAAFAFAYYLYTGLLAG